MIPNCAWSGLMIVTSGAERGSCRSCSCRVRARAAHRAERSIAAHATALGSDPTRPGTDPALSPALNGTRGVLLPTTSTCGGCDLAAVGRLGSAPRHAPSDPAGTGSDPKGAV